MRLKGRVALITGGAATARRFAAEGAAVAIIGRSVERGEEVVRGFVATDGEAPAPAGRA